MAKKKKTTGTGEDQGFLGGLRHDVGAALDIDRGAAEDVAHGIERGSIIGADVFKGDPSKAKAGGGKGGKGKGGTKPLTPAQMESQIEDQAAQNAWNQMGVALTNEATTEQAPITAAITGQNTGADVQSMENQALAAAGVSPNSSAAQWLNSNLQQGAAADQPLMSAMDAYGKAYGAGQQGVDTSLSNMGSANALGVATAPEQSWLQALPQHIQSNFNYSGGMSPSMVQNLQQTNPALLYYLQQSGAGGVSGTGLEQLTSVNVPGASQNAPPSPKTPALPGVGTAAGGATSTSVPSDAGAAPA